MQIVRSLSPRWEIDQSGLPPRPNPNLGNPSIDPEQLDSQGESGLPPTLTNFTIHGCHAASNLSVHLTDRSESA
jgi:hypothetical protein